MRNSAALGAAMAMPPIIGRAQSSGELNIMGNASYVPEAILKKFTAETGTRVNFRETTDSSQIINLLAADGNAGTTDMAVLAGHRMFGYIAVDALEPIDTDRLPGMANLNPIHRDAESQFINGTRYGVPVVIGFNLLGSREGVVDPALAESWESVFGDTHANRITMRTGSALYAAMFQLGVQDVWLNYDGNPEPVEAMFQELRDYVVDKKPLLRKWYGSSAELQQLFFTNEIDVGQGLNSSVMPLVVAAPDMVRRSIPVEGCMGWTFNYSLIKGGANHEAAYQLIDMLLNDPEAGGYMVRSTGGVSTFTDGVAGLSPEEQKAFSFTDEELSRIAWLDVKGIDDTRYELLDRYTAGLAEA